MSNDSKLEKLTLAEQEYGSFLSDFGFSLIHDENGDRFSYTAFQNKEIILAFTYQMGIGENIAIAELGAPVSAEAIANRTNGWHLVGEFWGGFYDEFHQARERNPYPYRLARDKKVEIFDRALRALMGMLRVGDISISAPQNLIDS